MKGTIIKFQLSEIIRTYERQVYTLIALLSDVGGFMDIIRLIPVIIMASYSERMYQAQIYSEIPKKKDKKDTKTSTMLKRLVKGDYKCGQNLLKDDLECLSEETKLMYKDPPDFYRNLFHIPRCCKKSSK